LLAVGIVACLGKMFDQWNIAISAVCKAGTIFSAAFRAEH